MSVLDVLLHVCSFFLPAVFCGLLTAVMAKGLWRRGLAAPWTVLTAWGIGAGALVLLAGLLWFGRDGKMATYLAMVLAVAVAVWWRGFIHPR